MRSISLAVTSRSCSLITALVASLLPVLVVAQDAPQNGADAVRGFRLSAEQGDVIAQWNLGFYFMQGRGVPQDYVVAHVWFNIASANGDPDAGLMRDEVAARMTTEQVGEAQRLARICMASGYQDCP